MYLTHKRKSIIIILIWLAIAIIGGRYVKLAFAQVVSPLPDTPYLSVTFPTSRPIFSPLPTPTPTLRQEIEREIERVWADTGAENIRMAKIIVGCESNYNPLAINKNSWDYGLFQINQVHAINPEYLLDWRVNIQVAKHLFDDQDWRPWYSSKWCQDYNL
jgi:hypothetical protein